MADQKKTFTEPVSPIEAAELVTGIMVGRLRILSTQDGDDE